MVSARSELTESVLPVHYYSIIIKNLVSLLLSTAVNSLLEEFRRLMPLYLRGTWGSLVLFFGIG